MASKTISINPAYFSVSGSKSRTKKNKTDKPPKLIEPIVSSSNLKKRLIERIKRHKNDELKNLGVNTSEIQSAGTSHVDEFNDSVNLFGGIASKQKAEALQRRTLKQPRFEGLDTISSPSIHLDLPEELSNTSFNTVTGSSMSLIKPEPLYGVLKGGKKQTYRQYYKKTLENTPKILLPESFPQMSEREKKLNNLKKRLQEIKTQKSTHTALDASPAAAAVVTNSPAAVVTNSATINPVPIIENNNNLLIHGDLTKEDQPLTFEEAEIQQEASAPVPAPAPAPAPVPVKQIIKKTIQRKYTLGKNRDKKKVAVLVKNRATRKKVLDACKKIKQHDIKEVKDFLRSHNFVKVGSHAPNNVLREMYEAIMLTGEVNNVNKETLLHNFSNS